MVPVTRVFRVVPWPGASLRSHVDPCHGHVYEKGAENIQAVDDPHEAMSKLRDGRVKEMRRGGPGYLVAGLLPAVTITGGVVVLRSVVRGVLSMI